MEAVSARCRTTNDISLLSDKYLALDDLRDARDANRHVVDSSKKKVVSRERFGRGHKPPVMNKVTVWQPDSPDDKLRLR
jgi:hypothetical protein